MAEIITMPKLGFDMAEGTLVRWAKEEGQPIEKGELLAEIETDKATVEVESVHSGTLRKHLVSAGTVVPVNAPIAVVGAPDEEIDLDALVSKTSEVPEAALVEEPAAGSTASQPEPVSAPAPSADGQLPDGVKASPLARRIAGEKGIDLKAVSGSGPGGRIVKQDVENLSAALPAQEKPTTPAFPFAVPPLAATDLAAPRQDKRVPLSKLRQIIGRRMVQSTVEFPQFYLTRTYDVESLMEVRRQVNTGLAPSGEKLSVNDFVVKAVALTLRQFPNLNASLDGDHVIQHGHINIGAAVAVEGGLLTVVVPDTDRKPLRQVSSELKEKTGRARAGRVRPDDIEGSTFSVSNLGMFDVTHFTAIINPPEAAILAVGAAQQLPVVKDGGIQPGWRMNATISIDHRVSDGAEAAQFMQALAQYLENPASLLL